MKFRVSTFFLQYVILYNLKYDASGEPITGENYRDAKVNEFPFVVSLSENEEGFDEELNHFCTGTLISMKHVITAAHCFDEEEIVDFHVVVGSNDLRNGKSYLPRNVFTYNKWALKHKKKLEFQTNDIAIVTLSEEVKENIHPAVIGTRPSHTLFGLSVTIAGWGDMNDEESPRYLQTANLMIIPNVLCENKVQCLSGIKQLFHERYLCSESDPVTLLGCGDSGGPLLDEHNVLLAVNKGVCPKPDEPHYSSIMNIHVGLRYYNHFITEVLAKH